MSDQEKILSALREMPLKVYEIMKRANISNEESRPGPMQVSWGHA